ncbi:MAG TPA: class I SAM-dependent methyltransferase [Candidatus Limnocylindria bacterium]
MTPVDRALQRIRERVALRHVPRGARLLDVGCADGTLSRRLGAHVREYVGIDPDAPDGDPRLQRGRFPDDLRALGPFDAITMLAVFEHFPESERAAVVAACWKLLRPGGRVIVTVPAPVVDRIVDVLRALHLVHGMDIEAHHGYLPEKTPSHFAGFRVVTHETFELGLNHLYVLERPAG